MVYFVIILTLWATFVHAATRADSAVSLVFKQADSGLAHFAVLKRAGVTEELDLVIMIGSPTPLPTEPAPWIGLSEEKKIGLFLQEKMRPDRVYSLGIKSGFEECDGHIERVSATDTVISCLGEKSSRYPHQKWVYDVRAKRLLGQFSYMPYAMNRSFASADGAVFVGTNSERQVAVEYKTDREPAFRVLSGTDERRWINRVRSFADSAPPPKTFPPLPQTTYDQFAAARPRSVENGLVRAFTLVKESVGPWEQENGRIWFGKTFYDGELHTGVGGFGYFDMNERRLHMIPTPEIADWSVSAIDVGPDAVWIALISNGEWGGSGGGLLRYDRQSGAVRRFELPDIVWRITRAGGKILAATELGLAVVEGDGVKRYFVDRTTDGRLRVAEATR